MYDWQNDNFKNLTKQKLYSIKYIRQKSSD